jgi:hypothetical protein
MTSRANTTALYTQLWNKRGTKPDEWLKEGCKKHVLNLSLLCRWFRFAQLAKGKKFRP